MTSSALGALRRGLRATRNAVQPALVLLLLTAVAISPVVTFFFWIPGSLYRVESCERSWIENNPVDALESLWPELSYEQASRKWNIGYEACEAASGLFDSWAWAFVISLVLCPLALALLVIRGDSGSYSPSFINGPTAVYTLYDRNGRVLYVGLTNNVDRRMRQHAHSKAWWGQVSRREVNWYGTRQIAASQEAFRIQLLQPRHNVQHNRQ